jgi:hypothetical protein
VPVRRVDAYRINTPGGDAIRFANPCLACTSMLNLLDHHAGIQQRLAANGASTCDTSHSKACVHPRCGYDASAEQQCPGSSISGTTSMWRAAAYATTSLICMKTAWRLSIMDVQPNNKSGASRSLAASALDHGGAMTYKLSIQALECHIPRPVCSSRHSGAHHPSRLAMRPHW